MPPRSPRQPRWPPRRPASWRAAERYRGTRCCCGPVASSRTPPGHRRTPKQRRPRRCSRGPRPPVEHADRGEPARLPAPCPRRRRPRGAPAPAHRWIERSLAWVHAADDPAQHAPVDCAPPGDPAGRRRRSVAGPPMHDRWADPGTSTELGQGDFSLGVAQRLGEDPAHGVRSHERRELRRKSLHRTGRYIPDYRNGQGCARDLAATSEQAWSVRGDTLHRRNS